MSDNVPEVPPPPPVLRLSLEIVGTLPQLLAGWNYVTEFIDPDEYEMQPGFSLRAGTVALDVTTYEEPPTND